MTFEFVENDRIDGAARKLIRSHVMKGKNVGKGRFLPTRNAGRQALLPGQGYVPDLPAEAFYQSTEAYETKIISIPQTIGHGFSPFQFPWGAEPYKRLLLHQFISITNQVVYPIEFCLSLDAGKSIWFQYLLSDEALFYSVLAMSEVCVDSLLGRQETSSGALQHLSNAYQCIHRNLLMHVIPSDSTIAAVMTLAIYEDLRVELRGGIAQFRANRVLLQKICRADIEYALHTGSYPRFDQDGFPCRKPGSIFVHLNHQEILSSTADDQQVYNPILRCVVSDLTSFSRLLNHSSQCFRLEPYVFQDILISLCYRLLHHYPVTSDGPEDDNENAHHLGLLAFMTTLLFQRGRSRRLSYVLLAERLRNAIDVTSKNGFMEETTFLWLLFVGGISVLDAVDRAWLLPQIKIHLCKLNIDSWGTVRGTLGKLPWMHSIHDRLGQELWQATIAS